MQTTSTAIAAAVVLLAAAAPTFAADPNGYTAQYECRAGGPRCNVDVAALAKLQCDQIVTPADKDWSKILNNPSQRVFCIQAGDHTAKGPLTIRFSGTSSSYKVLRYYRPNDSDDDPWAQSTSNQAKINRLRFIGARYWLVHRLVFDPNYAANSFAVQLGDSVTRSERIILNRILAQHGAKQVYIEGAHDTVVQNSVLRESIKVRGVDSDGIGMSYSPRNTWIVNNEIYRIHSHGVYTSANSVSPGTVVENNDIYADRSQWTNCSGTYTPNNLNSPCSDAEAAISVKAGGTRENPIRVIHNRIWGYRWTDTGVCCIAGSEGQMVSLSQESNSAANWVLVQNNILTDGQHGIQSPREGSGNNSIVGNLFYRIKNYRSSSTSRSSALDTLGHWDNNEVYLNTVVDSDSWALLGSGNTNMDLRCNAVVASGAHKGGTPDSGAVVDNNAFLGTVQVSTNGGKNDVVLPIQPRANSAFYRTGTLVRLGDVGACVAGNEAACFLYQAMSDGISGSAAPAACTMLGCEFVDGGVTWKAVRGPYLYKRKLRTVATGELAVVPYARVHANAAESYACNEGIGTRPSVGIDDVPLL